MVSNGFTDATGSYSFLGVPPGSYRVLVVPAAYWGPTFDTDGTGTPSSTVATVSAGQVLSGVDFGYQYAPPPGSVSDRVWIDTNSNGQLDVGELGLAGVTVQIRDSSGALLASAVTDAEGNYSFLSLAAGTYQVTILPPQYYTATWDLDGVSTANTAVVVLGIGQERTDVDFGLIYNPPPAFVGGAFWNDTNGNGIRESSELGFPGVAVTLLNSGGAVVATVTTDGSGTFAFPGLAAGTYSLSMVPPQYYIPTSVAGGVVSPNGTSFTLAVGQIYQLPAIGLIYAPPLGSIGDRVWIDDGNETFDPGESGLTGAVVTLRNGLGQVLQTVTVGADGLYLFANLEAGTYTVSVTPPANYFATSDQDGLGTPNSTEVTLLPGDNLMDVDFAYAYVAPDPMIGRIGDRVWLDLNGNGMEDGTEPGIAGVTVQLRNSAGVVLAVDTTDATGAYEFVNLAGGSYRVTVDQPAGYLPTYDSDTVATANTAAVFLVAGTEILDVDFGYQPPSTASIGNRVWIDRNSNGVQESTEPGLPSVWVVLANSAGTPIRTNLTTSTGAYLFSNLAPGTYTVRVFPPANYSPTWDVDGIGTVNGATVTVVVGQSRLDADFGYVASVGTGRIGDLIWIDADGDGTRNSESGLPNATVRLFDANGYLLATQQTDSNGRYQFTGLVANTYKVTVIPPVGYTPTYDLDSILTPQTATLTLSAGQTRNDVDFGYIRYSGHGGGCESDDDKDKDGDKDKDCDKDDDKDKDCDKDDDKDGSGSGSGGGESCYRNGGTTGIRCTPTYWRSEGQADLRPYDFAVLCQLRLVNDNGSDRDFNSTHSSNKSSFVSWLNSTSTSNMSRALSVQLACFQLNVLHGCYRSSSVVATPGIGSGRMTAGQLIEACNNALNADRNTPVGDPNRVTQERLRNALDACNQAARR